MQPFTIWLVEGDDNSSGRLDLGLFGGMFLPTFEGPFYSLKRR